MRRYLALLGIQIRAATLLALQYRLDFVLEMLMALFWSATALVPLYVLFSMRDGVAGWSAHEMLVVVGFFTLLKGVLASVIQPSLSQAVEHIRKGTLDFLLIKPADAQFMLSTAKLELAHLIDVLAGVVVIVYALGRLPGNVSLAAVAFALVLLACALLILYAMWILVVSLAFRVVKIDNMNYLFVSLFEAARWPASVFRGALALLFTFVIPLALMTTYPALALLGKATLRHFATAVTVAVVLLSVSRWVWKRALRSYAGASA
ncbi:MAG TPA: ABC-2 family transporter protein [Polyangiales bacterium]|nr:ABC-2 family transporter protein [Polyangiales bacterium]